VYNPDFILISLGSDHAIITPSFLIRVRYQHDNSKPRLTI